MEVVNSFKNNSESLQSCDNVISSFYGNHQLNCIPMTHSICKSIDSNKIKIQDKQIISTQMQNEIEIRLSRNIRSLSYFTKKTRKGSRNDGQSQFRSIIKQNSTYCNKFQDQKHTIQQKYTSNINKNSKVNKYNELKQQQRVLVSTIPNQNYCLDTKENFSIKLENLLKNIKQTNKQNSKAIYTIKKMKVKSNNKSRADQNKIKKHQIQMKDNNSVKIADINNNNFQIQIKQKKECPTCGCTCKNQ